LVTALARRTALVSSDRSLRSLLDHLWLLMRHFLRAQVSSDRSLLDHLWLLRRHFLRALARLIARC